MVVRIIDRGRGPEVEGTGVTVYRIMDFVRDGSSVGCIATELHLTEEQVHVALDSIAASTLSAASWECGRSRCRTRPITPGLLA